jgi:hypothetical protein
MNDINRNTRTLIMCFSLAVLGLIPLRFVEVGQMMDAAVNQQEVQVLGETTQNEVVLPPTAEISPDSETGLEAPYNEVDGPCLTNADYVAKMDLINNELSGKLTKAEENNLINLSVSLESRRCR